MDAPNDVTTTTVDDQIERPDWLPQEVWPFTLRRTEATVDGEVVDIHYTDEGDGPAMVLVHAGLWSFVWRDLITELSKDFRCITLDLPGAGLSGGSEHLIALGSFPAVVTGLLDELGVAHATLVVHDLGGVVGVLAAAGRPGRIDGIAAINTFAWRADKPSLRAMLALLGSAPVTRTVGTLGVIPAFSSTRFGVGRALDKRARDAFLGPYQDRARARGFHRTMHSAATSPALFEDAENALTTTLADLPVLTVFGEHNDPFGFADRWRALFPQARSWVVADGNHFPMCDDAPGLAHELRAWHGIEVAQS